jgi:hypothetical protein
MDFLKRYIPEINTYTYSFMRNKRRHNDKFGVLFLNSTSDNEQCELAKTENHGLILNKLSLISIVLN